MKLRCWPGCLAVVHAATATPELKGCVVNVVRRYVGGTRIGGRIWEEIGACWVVEGENIPCRTHKGEFLLLSERVVLDSLMTPITPPPGTEVTDQQQELTA